MKLQDYLDIYYNVIAYKAYEDKLIQLRESRTGRQITLIETENYIKVRKLYDNE